MVIKPNQGVISGGEAWLRSHKNPTIGERTVSRTNRILIKSFANSKRDWDTADFAIRGNKLHTKTKESSISTVVAWRLSHKVAIVRSFKQTFFPDGNAGIIINQLEVAGYYCISVKDEDKIDIETLSGLAGQLREDYERLKARIMKNEVNKKDSELGAFIYLGAEEQHIGEIHRGILAIREYISGLRKKSDLKILKELQEIIPGGYHMPFPGATAPQIVAERLNEAKSLLESIDNHIDLISMIQKADGYINVLKTISGAQDG